MSGMGGPWTARKALPLLLGALLAASALSACSGDDGDTPAAESGTVLVATVPVGELSGAPTELVIGEVIEVVVDTPDIDWTVTSSDEAVVEIEGAGQNPGVVRLVAIAAGDTEVVFDGGADANDRIDLEVVAG